MKKILLISSVVSLFVGTINAQVQTSPAVRAKEKVSEISRLGGVDQQQIGKINSLYIDFYTKQDALKSNAKTLGKDFDVQMAELKNKHNLSLKEVLTADQIKKFEAAQTNVLNVPGDPARK